LLTTNSIWAGQEHRVMFYDSGGQRFDERRLGEVPDVGEVAV
jgi:hypothetical protein